MAKKSTGSPVDLPKTPVANVQQGKPLGPTTGDGKSGKGK